MQRHGFVTFFLWFFVIQGIPALNNFFSGNFVLGVPSILTCIAGILLLKWKICGFFIHCIACFFNAFVIIEYFGHSISVAITACAIGIAIPYAVLKIKKNGVSAWGYLIGENTQNKNSAENQFASTIPDFKEDIFYLVMKETPLNDSLSTNPKLKRVLKQNEKIKIKHIQERLDLGGIWVLVETETKDEGWCLFDVLKELKEA